MPVPYLEKRTDEDYVALVALAPEHVQSALARMLWWDHVDDRKASRADDDKAISDTRAYPHGLPLLKELGRHFEIDREDVDLTVEEVEAALLACAYTERAALKRAKSFVRMQEEYRFIVPTR